MVRAVNKFIVLEKEKEEDNVVSSSGLILGAREHSEMRYHRGRVKVVGDKVDVIKEGDEVLYDKVHAHSVMIDGVECIVIQEASVVVVL